MPADDRVRSNDPQAGLPSPLPSREPDPKGTIWTREAGRLGGALKHQELVPEGQVFEDQVATTPQRRHGQTNKQHEPGSHAVEDARQFPSIPLSLGAPKLSHCPCSPVPASPCESRATLHGWWRLDRTEISGFVSQSFPHLPPTGPQWTMHWFPGRFAPFGPGLNRPRLAPRTAAGLQKRVTTSVRTARSLILL
jgi:hypothetical protein